MSRRRRVLLALYGAAVALAALPWVLDTAGRVLRRQPWRSPAIPSVQLAEIQRLRRLQTRLISPAGHRAGALPYRLDTPRRTP